MHWRWCCILYNFSHSLISTLLIILSLSVAALFNSAEAAIFTISTYQLTHLKHGIGKHIVPLLYKREYLISILQIVITLNNLFSVSIGALNYSDVFKKFFMTRFALSYSIANFLSIFLVTGIFTAIQLVFVEILPKRIGFNYPTTIISSLSLIIILTDIVFRPFARILHLISNVFIEIFFKKQKKQNNKTALNKVEYLMNNEELLDDNKSKFIMKLIKLSNVNINDVIVPRINVNFINSEMKIDSAVKMLPELKFKYYPVYENTTKDTSVVGFLDTDRLYQLSVKKDQNIVCIRDIAEKVRLFPRTIDLFSLLVEMTEKNLPLAVIMDEYFNIIGCVFLQDIITRMGSLE